MGFLVPSNFVGEPTHLTLYSIQEPPSPDKLSGKDRKPDGDDHECRPRKNQQSQTNKKN
jgi:hypothetical protein